MNKQNQELSSEFKEGFNKGYILMEHKPDLAKSLRQTKFPESQKEYGDGLHAGIDQKEIEIAKERAKPRYKGNILDRLKEEYKDDLNLSSKDKTKGKDIDRD